MKVSDYTDLTNQAAPLDDVDGNSSIPLKVYTSDAANKTALWSDRRGGCICKP